MKAKTASGPDRISCHTVHITASFVHTFLSAAGLFNKFLDTGIFPEACKLSNVIPIFKAGDPKLASNYRPILLLSLPFKILEHNVQNNLLHFLLSNSLFSCRQIGFRTGSST